MTDLETRLRSLRQFPTSGPSAAEIRQRASRRGRSRRRRLRGSALVVLVASTVGVLAMQAGDDESDDIVTGPAPASMAASIIPAVDLQDNQEVTLTAQGLRPNATFEVRLCESAPRQNCSVDPLGATTDGAGALATTVTVHAAIYGYGGRTDCVAAACNVVVGNVYGDSLVAVPMQFAQGVVAPVPRLTIDPPGPYSHLQTIEVHGSGFPPGLDLNGHLGQCPAELDTAVEERCGYDLFEETVVDSRGEFRATIRLFDSLLFTGTCVTGPGCVLAWVIRNGPIVASIPLEFRQ